MEQKYEKLTTTFVPIKAKGYGTYDFEHIQCDQIGIFLKVLKAIFRTKVAQISRDVMGNLEMHYYLNENYSRYFCATFYNNWATF